MSDQGRTAPLAAVSYNIQSGLTTRKYSQYFTRSWKHLVPVPSRMSNLDGIARVLTDYDLVGLQEVDAGSLRSGFVNQVKYLADYAGFGVHVRSVQPPDRHDFAAWQCGAQPHPADRHHRNTSCRG